MDRAALTVLHRRVDTRHLSEQQRQELKELHDAYLAVVLMQLLRTTRDETPPRTPKSPRTVEVQREDGSTVDIGIDPDNAESVRSFLDAARRAGGERVVAVH
jgi:hypothetical protein